MIPKTGESKTTTPKDEKSKKTILKDDMLQKTGESKTTMLKDEESKTTTLKYDMLQKTGESKTTTPKDEESKTTTLKYDMLHKTGESKTTPSKDEESKTTILKNNMLQKTGESKTTTPKDEESKATTLKYDMITKIGKSKKTTPKDDESKTTILKNDMLPKAGESKTTTPKDRESKSTTSKEPTISHNRELTSTTLNDDTVTETEDFKTTMKQKPKIDDLKKPEEEDSSKIWEETTFKTLVKYNPLGYVSDNSTMYNDTGDSLEFRSYYYEDDLVNMAEQENTTGKDLVKVTELRYDIYDETITKENSTEVHYDVEDENPSKNGTPNVKNPKNNNLTGPIKEEENNYFFELENSTDSSDKDGDKKLELELENSDQPNELSKSVELENSTDSIDKDGDKQLELELENSDQPNKLSKSVEFKKSNNSNMQDKQLELELENKNDSKVTHDSKSIEFKASNSLKEIELEAGLKNSSSRNNVTNSTQAEDKELKFRSDELEQAKKLSKTIETSVELSTANRSNENLTLESDLTNGTSDNIKGVQKKSLNENSKNISNEKEMEFEFMENPTEKAYKNSNINVSQNVQNINSSIAVIELGPTIQNGGALNNELQKNVSQKAELEFDFGNDSGNETVKDVRIETTDFIPKDIKDVLETEIETVLTNDSSQNKSNNSTNLELEFDDFSGKTKETNIEVKTYKSGGVNGDENIKLESTLEQGNSIDSESSATSQVLEFDLSQGSPTTKITENGTITRSYKLKDETTFKLITEEFRSKKSNKNPKNIVRTIKLITTLSNNGINLSINDTVTSSRLNQGKYESIEMEFDNLKEVDGAAKVIHEVVHTNFSGTFTVNVSDVNILVNPSQLESYEIILNNTFTDSLAKEANTKNNTLGKN